MPATEITAGQLADLIIQKLSNKIEPAEKPKLSQGLDALAQKLGVSISTVVRLKRTGVFGDSITQNGRVIHVDLDKAVEYYFDKTKRKQRAAAAKEDNHAVKRYIG